ncbi:MAG: hypothetical protein R6U11_00200, partial [Bacteroidales bacterium]
MKKNIGKFVVSIDFELAWGGVFNENILRNNLELYKKTRKAIDAIIELFEKYQISATWAFVGHLMLESCAKVDNRKHPEIIRPNYSWYDKDWFYYDPCYREEENSIWYADDVLKRIMSCQVEQEIASHSFSHILFGEEGCSKECAESDIRKCIEVASSYNIKLSSFIFPFNSIGHKDILKKYGFIIYRDHGIERYSKIKNNKVKSIASIIDKVLAFSPTTGRIKKDEYGLYCIQGNMCYYRYKGWKNKITYKSAVKQAKKGIDLAIEKGELFHLWFHPYQIADNL